ncbi:MAG: DUF2442 domain-containing protein [Anaerolineae bacterium]|nr:DUF2442 domain-containing protein [Anaerolineae bacterium]
MKMTSDPPDADVPDNEVTDICRHEFWLLADDREHFVPFSDYPVFWKATVEQIYAVERVGPARFHWSELDVDLDLEAFSSKARRILIARNAAATRKAVREGREQTGSVDDLERDLINDYDLGQAEV